MPKFLGSMARPMMLGIVASLFSAYGLASNGMYLPGYGMDSVLMGGADVAVARDAFATTNNPSGMTQLSGRAADLQLVGYDKQEYSHTDPYGNNHKPDAMGTGAYASGAYARRFENSPYAAGVALSVQGGMGWAWHGLNTQYGTRDDAAALFTIIKLAPAVAWEVNKQLSLGAALGINYMSANQELFPNTSSATSATGPFFGIRFKGASGIGLNSKWGLQYRPARDVTIGVTYATQTAVPMKNGTLRINLSDPALGPGALGVVRYDTAKLTGFHMPEELALGISFRPAPSLLISLQDKWYNWSDAISKLQLTASNPRTPGAVPTLVLPSSPAFTDQHVVSIGLAYDYDRDTVLMAGVNHGSRPIPDQSVSPVFRPIPARHYMFGAKRQIDKEWNVGGGVEFIVPQTVTYDSQVFGHAYERDYALEFFLSVARRW